MSKGRRFAFAWVFAMVGCGKPPTPIKLEVHPAGIGEIVTTSDCGSGNGMPTVCEDSCACLFETTIAVTAAPIDDHWIFESWSGDAEGCTGTTPSLALPVQNNGGSCVASFVEKTRFTVAVAPAGSGEIGVQTFRCKDSCAIDGGLDKKFRLQAYPKLGFVFDHWNSPGFDVENCLGQNPTVDVTVAVNSDKSVCTAHFKADPSPVTSALIQFLKLPLDQQKALAPLFKTSDDKKCTPYSTGNPCLDPEAITHLMKSLDPIFTMNAAAVARVFGQVFPCGQGPNALTLCASQSAPPVGDWVFLQNILAADVPTQDPKSYFQYAWVFDADGIAANNYVPGAMYPKDFFAGTDKWYEADYAPAKGWSLRVRDVRQGTMDVPSDARIVIYKGEMGIFLPRKELDGMSPTFRTTTFRHEGDYGLMGGPWSGDYWPTLTMPLAPVESQSFVVP